MLELFSAYAAALCTSVVKGAESKSVFMADAPQKGESDRFA
jgi:hypothetical protein